MSNRMPFPEQAPAASPSSEYTVMSWHWLVTDTLPVSCDTADFRALIAPVRGSIKTRGLDTTLASWGDFRGTFITSMRNSAVFGSLSGAPLEQPASSSFCRTKDVPET